jgi:cell division protease FtsH
LLDKLHGDFPISIICGHRCGAAQDLQEASRISLDMVSKFGFNVDGNLFSLAALPAQYAGLQMKTAIEHANILLKHLNEACYALLRDNEPVLRAIAEQLLESETVPGATVYRLIEEHKAKKDGLHLAQKLAAA